jgi:citrate synthase
MPENTLTITDNRTGKTYTVPVEDGTIRAMNLRQIKTGPEDFGLMTYDPAFMNTASCKSAITFIDGDKGILRYRGYPIDELAERRSFLQVAYLLIYGELPTAEQESSFQSRIREHTMLHEDLKEFFAGFPRDAHPMAVLSSAVSALSTFYQDSLDPFDDEHVEISTVRLLAKLPHTPTRSRSASRSSTRTTPWATRRTSCG